MLESKASVQHSNDCCCVVHGTSVPCGHHHVVRHDVRVRVFGEPLYGLPTAAKRDDHRGGGTARNQAWNLTRTSSVRRLVRGLGIGPNRCLDWGIAFALQYL